MLTFDHIAVACIDLPEASSILSSLIGTDLQQGGQHERYGTYNVLLGLGDLYLELIAKDPSAAPTGRPAWFALDDFIGPLRPTNWICRSDDLLQDIAQAPVNPGSVVPLVRGDLHWQITVPNDGSLPLDGAMPTLIQWGKGTRHPTDRLPDSGCRLVDWQVIHPQANMLRAGVRLVDHRVAFVTGPAGFSLTLDTPRGRVTL